MDVLKGKSPSKDFLCQAQDKIDERPSSPNDCAICLEQLTDKSFTNSCLHMFCFHCLLAWSKVKPECPLCKQGFYSIIHNIRSMTDYDEYHVPPPEARLSMYLNPDPPPADLYAHSHDFFSNDRQFFSYRTTFAPSGYTVPRGRSSNLVIRPYVDTNLEIQTNFPIFNSSHQTRSQSRFPRLEVYRKDLETIPPPAHGRYRECSPEFYRENEGQIHRLARWLQREFTALTQAGARFDPHLLLRLIMDMLPIYSINNTIFYNTVNRYLRPYTSRFIREFLNFAVSPYEMDHYDRECVYVRQRSGSNSQFIVSMSGDDAEDVQVIPNPTDFSARPWIDVNDLNAAHHQPCSSGVYSVPARPSCRPSFSSSRPSVSTSQPTVLSTNQLPNVSHAVIDISDSENDDCIIIVEGRTQPETIVLDDSDPEPATPEQRSLVKRLPNSVAPSRALDLSTDRTSSPIVCQNRASTVALDLSKDRSSPSRSFTNTQSIPSTSSQSTSAAATPGCSSLDLIKTYCKFEEESDVAVEYQSKAPDAPSCDRSRARSSSVLSTEISSDDAKDCAVMRNKRKRSRRFYKMKHSRKHHCGCCSSDDPTYVSACSSVMSDGDDEDWEESAHKRKKKIKKPRPEKHAKKNSTKKRRRASDSTSKSTAKKMTTMLPDEVSEGEEKSKKKKKKTSKTILPGEVDAGEEKQQRKKKRSLTILSDDVDSGEEKQKRRSTTTMSDEVESGEEKSKKQKKKSKIIVSNEVDSSRDEKQKTKTTKSDDISAITSYYGSKSSLEPSPSGWRKRTCDTVKKSMKRKKKAVAILSDEADSGGERHKKKKRKAMMVLSHEVNSDEEEIPKKSKTSKLDDASPSTYYGLKSILEPSTSGSSQRIKSRLRSVVRKVENKVEVPGVERYGDTIEGTPGTSYEIYGFLRESANPLGLFVNCGFPSGSDSD